MYSVNNVKLLWIIIICWLTANKLIANKSVSELLTFLSPDHLLGLKSSEKYWIMRGGINILFLNANDLRSKLDELRDFIVDNPIGLILVQEVRCTSFRDLNIQNFKLYFYSSYRWYHYFALRRDCYFRK